MDWHRDYSPPAWRHRTTKEQKRIGWERAQRILSILCAVLQEAHRGQTMETLVGGRSACIDAGIGVVHKDPITSLWPPPVAHLGSPDTTHSPANER
jgi:hypothetical protein